MNTTRAHIALGANLGDRDATIRAALRALDDHPHITLIAAADPIDTDPVGPPGQPRYLNTAATLDTTLDPRALLDAMLAVERSLGRTRADDAVRWGPRTIDLDLLLMGGAILDVPGLTIPHPRLHTRRFVLEPLAAIAPDARHPILGATIAELLAALPVESSA